MNDIHWTRIRSHYLVTAGMRLYASVFAHLLAELAPTETRRDAALLRARAAVHELILILRSERGDRL